MVVTLGELFVDALAKKDASTLKSLLSPGVDFKGLTPGQFWESNDVDEVVDRNLLGQWFEPPDQITAIMGIESGHIGLRERVGYRLSLASPDGDRVVEQQAFYETDGVTHVAAHPVLRFPTGGRPLIAHGASTEF
jgi:hypothetical protein